MDRKIQQELCIALGMTLNDGSQITVGGEKCPPIKRIAERMVELGLEVVRIGEETRSDNIDDAGMYGRYYVSGQNELPQEAQDILSRDIAANCLDGDDVMAALLVSWPATCVARRTK